MGILIKEGYSVGVVLAFFVSLPPPPLIWPFKNLGQMLRGIGDAAPAVSIAAVCNSYDEGGVTGADIVELNIHPTTDGQLVIFHDRR